MKNKIIGISRVRNEETIIKDVLDHLSDYLHGVIIYDDASDDNTLSILNHHSLVLQVIENSKWEKNRYNRKEAEGKHRQLLFDTAKKYSPDWVYVFDADEFVEFKSDIDLYDLNYDAYFFRLYDYYITSGDVSKYYKERRFLGPEYRDIPMLFRANLDLKFHSRVPKGFDNINFGGYIKHYGKARSVEDWQDKCNYYINHLIENQPGNIDISDKWQKRLGKAIHSRSDFFNKLIKWEQKDDLGIELTHDLEKLSTLNLDILIATNSLNSIGGSETFTYTIIEELNKYPNFKIEYFTFHRGYISDKLENDLGVNFMSLKKYDLILANHNTVVDKLHRMGTIIQTCHGIFPSLEQPNRKANGFISISQEIQNHLASYGFVSKLIYNSININRFYPKSDINRKVKVVLSLCHSKEANDIVKNVSEDLGLEYIQAYKYENPVWDIENLINKADIVFGLGRSAYEAMSCGRPVVVYDNRQYFSSYGDGYVKNLLGFSLLNNCSGRYSKNRYSIDDLKKEVNKYNSNDQSFFRDFAVRELDVRKNVVKYIEYYLALKSLEKRNTLYFRVKSTTKRIIKKIISLIRKKIKSTFETSF